ncbi:hypothetical protein [Flagellimonas halotolerans]|uniref:Uncharacterized protein n=1 Tax=Flagellimonas halotolerans TaxID=3112164 RepID=A0ABU6IUB4_9FLAO|nr:MULTISPECIES: hypothetical protein [unclassified Allomuricauda]MEC3966782.1 hypothetical protein [Muricauda sp. SYSU M86414]MEC4266702.1 hypothetical protein [Muricauda sp. SYSU M84420]
MKPIKLFSISILALGISMVSCSSEDGTDGKDGLDGENGVGFDELTRYGYITLEMEGIRVDDVLFQDSTAFKFIPIDPAELPINNNADFGGNTYFFDIRRFLSVPDKNQDDTNSFVKITLEVTNPGEDSQSIDLFNIQINEYAVVGERQQIFCCGRCLAFSHPLKMMT